MLIYILLILSILALLAYVVMIFLQRRYSTQSQETVQRKNELDTKSIQEKLVAARSLSLTGKSLHEYQQLESDFNDVLNNKFKTIDELANTVEASSKSLNIFKTREESKKLQDSFKLTDQKLNDIREGISRLNRLDEEHKEAVTNLRNEYESLRTQILGDSAKYGSASDALVDELTNLETDFAKFVELSESGDHDTANDIYEQLKVETNELKEKMVIIPEKFEIINTEDPQRIQEVQDGVRQLTEQGFVFPMDMQKALADIDNQITILNEDLHNLDVKKFDLDHGMLDQQIGNIRGEIENQYAAKYDVDKNTKDLAAMLERVRVQNQELTIKLDQLSELFILDHNQVEDTRQWATRIKTKAEEIDELNSKMDASRRTFSSVREDQDKILLDLNQISNDQTALYKTVNTYPQTANDLKKSANDYFALLQKIKLSIERLGLPGLSADYRLAYQNTEESINKFGEMVNAPRLNIDEAQRQASQVVTDMDDFRALSTDVYSYSSLAQQAIRYLARYQNSQGMADAYSRAVLMYDQDFNYQGSAEEAGRAINQVEPGRYDQLRADFFERNAKPF